MIFPSLIKGRLLKRYKRFLADIELESGEIVTAHCPNTGSMTQCKDEGSDVLLSISDNPKRKLKYTWEFIKIKGHFACINTHRANKIVMSALSKDFFKDIRLTRDLSVKPEVKYGENSRVDLLIDGNIYLEIKNVTLTDGNKTAIFPDAISKRGLKHLKELEKVVTSGKRAMMVYLVQRGECTGFKPAVKIDPIYTRAFYEAKEKGVEMIAVKTIFTPLENKLSLKEFLTIDK